MFLASRIINSKQLGRIKSLIIIVNLNLKGYTFFIHTVDEFIYWSSVECRRLNVEGEGKKSRARVKSRG